MDKKELKALTVSIIEKLRQAIKDGDKEKALELTDQIDRNKHDFDESYRVWIDLMLTYIADKLGEDALYEIHRINADRALWPRFDWVFDPSVSTEEKIRRRARTWTDWHMINIDSIEEDDEKFTIKLKCDSGGSIRMWKDYGKTKKAHPWSWGQKGLSYYCAHCPVVHEIMAIEKGGRPTWLCEPQPEGGCIQTWYKDPARIPEKVYERIGMKKEKDGGH
jgi:hypothetical protein